MNQINPTALEAAIASGSGHVDDNNDLHYDGSQISDRHDRFPAIKPWMGWDEREWTRHGSIEAAARVAVETYNAVLVPGVRREAELRPGEFICRGENPRCYHVMTIATDGMPMALRSVWADRLAA